MMLPCLRSIENQSETLQAQVEIVRDDQRGQWSRGLAQKDWASKQYTNECALWQFVSTADSLLHAEAFSVVLFKWSVVALWITQRISSAGCRYENRQ
jgi:hypothetical protein